jgi:tubulin--tyrosine ligase
MQYKAYICKGNNGLLVKSIIKSRPWWALRSNSDIDNCSLVWTEWKKTKLTNSLPSK